MSLFSVQALLRNDRQCFVIGSVYWSHVSVLILFVFTNDITALCLFFFLFVSGELLRIFLLVVNIFDTKIYSLLESLLCSSPCSFCFPRLEDIPSAKLGDLVTPLACFNNGQILHGDEVTRQVHSQKEGGGHGSVHFSPYFNSLFSESIIL